MIVASLLLVGLAQGYWKRTEYHGTSLWCDKDQFLTGVCTSGKWDNCRYDNDWKAQGAYCQEGNTGSFVLPGGKYSKWYSAKYKMAKYHGTTIACDITREEVAVGICSSGQYKDCRCAGTEDEGCVDKSGHSHFLFCARGVSIDKTMTKEYYGDRGDDLKCPAGYVAYKFCASGAYWDCRKRSGWKTNTVLGCVKVNKVPGPGAPAKTIDKVVGYWKHVLTGGEGAKKTVAIQVTDATTKVLQKEDTKEYGFGQSVSVEISEGVDSSYVKGGFTFEASQSVSSTIMSSTSTAITNAVTDTEEVDCGDTDKKGFESIWQWCQQTELKNGETGPLVQTSSFTCTLGTEKSNIPVCAPWDCRTTACRPPCKTMKASKGVIEVPEVKSVPKWAMYGAGVVALMTVTIGGMKAFKGSKYQAIDTEANPETPVLAA